MTERTLIVALFLATSVATLGIAAFLLRYVVRDTLELASALPVRVPKDETAESRANNRSTLLREVVALLVVRSIPGILLILCGIALVAWTLCNVGLEVGVRSDTPFWLELERPRIDF